MTRTYLGENHIVNHSKFALPQGSLMFLKGGNHSTRVI
jgi:hypothetical protein